MSEVCDGFLILFIEVLLDGAVVLVIVVAIAKMNKLMR